LSGPEETWTCCGNVCATDRGGPGCGSDGIASRRRRGFQAWDDREGHSAALVPEGGDAWNGAADFVGKALLLPGVRFTLEGRRSKAGWAGDPRRGLFRARPSSRVGDGCSRGCLLLFINNSAAVAAGDYGSVAGFTLYLVEGGRRTSCTGGPPTAYAGRTASRRCGNAGGKRGGRPWTQLDPWASPVRSRQHPGIP